MNTLLPIAILATLFLAWVFTVILSDIKKAKRSYHLTELRHFLKDHLHGEFFEQDVKRWLEKKYDGVYGPAHIEKILAGIFSLPYTEYIGPCKYRIVNLPVEII